MRLVLFDIDGTLIDSGGAGTRGLNQAFSQLFSIRDAKNGVPMAGRTDREIISEMLSVHGLPEDEGSIAAVEECYLSHLEIEIDSGGRHLKPGLPGLLDRLMEMEGVSLGLLTGNLEKGARIKLSAFGLNRYFGFGAFGSDDMDRNRLLPIAVIDHVI